VELEWREMSEYEFSKLNFPEAPLIIVKPPGPRAAELIEKSKNFEPFSPPTQPVRRNLTVIEEAKGSTLKDVDGNIFIDMSAGVGVMNVGHANPEVVKALKDQTDKIIHSYVNPTVNRIQLMERLAEISPGTLKNRTRMLFAVGGGDAVEGAVKLAKWVTGQHTMVAFQGAYHGQGAGSLALTSSSFWKRGVSPLMPEVYRVPYAYCYRCAFGKTYPECDLQCVRYIELHFKDPHMGLSEPAGLIVESMQGEGGYIVPPKEFLPELRRICTENKVPLIVDEIQTGFGRTGRMFACEHTNVTPDILVISKAIAGGFPGFAAILSKKEYLENVERGPLFHIGTFRANPLGCAGALANIDFIQKHNLPRRAEQLGEYMLNAIKDLPSESRIVGDVRGKGLFIGVELVKNKETKEPGGDLNDAVIAKMFERGVVLLRCGHFGNVTRFIPALTVTQELIDKTVEIFQDVIKEVERSL
jgi:4-aminobutyrate aminotransferase